MASRTKKKLTAEEKAKKHRSYQRAYYRKNKEALLEAHKRWYRENKLRSKKSAQKYKSANKDKVKESNRRYYASHKAYFRRYYKARCQRNTQSTAQA